MKVIVLVVLFLGNLCRGLDIKTIRSMLPSAFENVSQHLFKLETRMFINNYGVDPRTMTWLVLKNLNVKAMPFRLQSRQLNTKQVLMDSSAFLTFDSYKQLRIFNMKLNLTNDIYKPLQLFVFCVGANVETIEYLAVDVRTQAKKNPLECNYGNHGYSYANTELTHPIQYEYFLVNEVQYIKLLTFVYYSPTKCGEWHLIEINRFSKETAKWENDNFSMDKLTNFHGCEIIFFTPYRVRGSWFHTFVPIDLATHLNYKYIKASDRPLITAIFSKGCFDALDLYVDDAASYHHTTSGKKYMVTWPVEYSPLMFAVPPSENYSEYEKLSMPFDNFTWALITLIFFVAFATILVLHWLPLEIRHFVIGSNITTPALNVTQVFFGLGMITLPRRNFARFLLMSFILYSLIIRTTWQGKMYEFMQKDISKPEIQTVEEAIEKGYEFLMPYEFREKFPESEIAKRAKFSGKTDVLKEILSPNYKFVEAVYPTEAARYSKHSKGRFAKRIRKEVVIHVNMCGMRLLRHHHFAGIFDRKTRQLFAGGMIRHNTSYTTFENDFKSVGQHFKHLFFDTGPKVLNMEMLEPGFVIWVSSLSFAVLAILFEWLLTLKDLLVFKYIFLALYQSRTV